MRAVLDTNVVVSGLIWGGKPLAVFQEAVAGRVELFTSRALLTELEGVLMRPHLRERLQRARKTVPEVLAFYTRLAEVVDAPELTAPVCRDPDDDKVLAAAVAARADWVVTGDLDLLSMGSFQGAAVLTPAEALERILAG